MTYPDFVAQGSNSQSESHLTDDSQSILPETGG